MRSNKYPQDFLEDIRDLLAEELSVPNVAWYLGAPIWLVRYVNNPEPILRANVNWRSRNREHSLAKMREYGKRYWKGKGHHKKNRPVDNVVAP